MSPSERAFDALAKSERLTEIVALVSPWFDKITETRTCSWDASTPDDVSPFLVEGFGNVAEILKLGPRGDVDWALLSAVCAHVFAERPKKDPDAADALTRRVLWLAVATPMDVLPLVERALGDGAVEFWESLGALLRQGKLTHAEALVACSALATAKMGRIVAQRSIDATKDPILRTILEQGLAASARLRAKSSEASTHTGATGRASAPESAGQPGAQVLEGEIASVPRSPMVTALLALTGLLLASYAIRAGLRVGLAFREPARVEIQPDSVEILSHTEILGRTLRERRVVIGRAGLVRVTREVLFPRMSFYAGLVALALGSYLGVRTFVDGVRAASPSLLGSGLLVVVVGIGIDFALSVLAPGRKGRCRIVFQLVKGRSICVANVPAERADEVLSALVGHPTTT